MDMRSALLLLLAPAFLMAQTPRIGIIDFYGVRKASEEKLRKALGVKEGDYLPPSKADVEERLERVPEVVRARLEAVCCDGPSAILFVGIEEKGAAHFNFRATPSGEVSLPKDITDTYESFMGLFETAVRVGDSAEDVTQGHSLSANSQVRTVQEQFIELADKHFDTLRKVLRDSGDGQQRAIAAHVIAYSSKKKLAAGELQYAMQDPDDSVRNNAMRALRGIAVLARRDPDLGIRVEPTWFIEMLNSILWTDRNKAALALSELTESRDPNVLDQIRERALPSLVEMARWKSLGHSLPAFLILGRIAGLPDDDVQAAWSKGDREPVIAKAVKSRSK